MITLPGVGWIDAQFADDILNNRANECIDILKHHILPDAMDPCGKRWFHSKEEAEHELAHLHSTRGPKFKLNSYYCFGCDGFHIGHTRISARDRAPS